MPITPKTLEYKGLNRYDVYVEDRSDVSEYFQVSNLPPQFGGGRNSFLLNGSRYLRDRSDIQIEILDFAGNPIYHRFVSNYVEGKGKLVSVEIYNTTPAGIATIIVMGKLSFLKDGTPVPPELVNKYNVRWVKNILVNPSVYTTSPLRFQTTPQATAQETRFQSVLSSSYDTYSTPVTMSLTPLYESAAHIGYGINVISPTTFSSEHFGGKLTGSVEIQGTRVPINIPLSDILNNKTAISYGYLITSPLSSTKKINGITLQNGSYSSSILGTSYLVSASVQLNYSKLNENLTKVPTSYANIRITDMTTVSGEVYKIKAYSRAATSRAEYKLVGDVNVKTSELLVSASLVGNSPIGYSYLTPNISNNWYAGTLVSNTGIRSAVYKLSGSDAYYDSTITTNTFAISSSNELLLSSLYAGIPIDTNTNKFAGSVSQSGYFIGNVNRVLLSPTTEYTLEFDAVYTSVTASVDLQGNLPRLDIYLVGTSAVSTIGNDPLGQRIGQVIPTRNTERYSQRQFNFTPAIRTAVGMGIRFVATNGVWYFSNISLKPASDTRFSPDEFQFLLPNTDYYNQVLDYKLEFFDINSNSSEVIVFTQPTFFTGSAIDLGTIP